MKRLRVRSLMDISQVQYFGFMPDRGTRNAIFVLRRLVERSIQKQKYVPHVSLITTRHRIQ